jgi:hypothetical protein
MLGPRFCCAEISGLYSVFPSPSLFGVDQEGPSPCPPVHVQPGVAVPRNLADLQRRLLIALLCSALHRGGQSRDRITQGPLLFRGERGDFITILPGKGFGSRAQLLEIFLGFDHGETSGSSMDVV